jgi:prepilin-type processing-associated H-X9-DG protein
MTDQNLPLPETSIPNMTESNDLIPPKRSGFAAASLILGITGFITCGITAAIGLILGIISLVQMGKDKSLTGQKLAVAGVIVSSIAVICIPVYAIVGAIAFPFFAKAREAAHATTCMSNVKQISTCMMMYSGENDDTLPASGKWVEAVSVYLHNDGILQCPSEKTHGTCYAMNSKLNIISVKKIKSPIDTVMIFESNPMDNPNGGKELLPYPGRHSHTNNIGFADGHVKWIRDEDLASVKWDPAGK